ncbi:hypothetical protein MKX08_005862 [Trichoderma sp. CBMAI-0020]|nr:hypothetical protein MKX08_005862 [Trichoderma sp. CBMAI-0020]
MEIQHIFGHSFPVSGVLVNFNYRRDTPNYTIPEPLKNVRQSQGVDLSRGGVVIVPDIGEFFRLGNNIIVLQQLKGERAVELFGYITSLDNLALEERPNIGRVLDIIELSSKLRVSIFQICLVGPFVDVEPGDAATSNF